MDSIPVKRYDIPGEGIIGRDGPPISICKLNDGTIYIQAKEICTFRPGHKGGRKLPIYRLLDQILAEAEIMAKNKKS